MEYRIEFDQEEDGRWIADIPELPGVLAYGATKEEAKARAEALALQGPATALKNCQEERSETG